MDLIYKKWLPLPDIPDRLLFEALYHEPDEKFRVFLRSEDDNRLLKICFEFVLMYAATNESYLLRTLQETARRDPGCLYTVEQSRLLQRFHEESLGIYQDWNITHYAILTPEECVDILSTVKPEVSWTKR